jgi:hypothetical protein
MLFCQHFTGTMDNWDPIITNTLAQDREVILFDNQVLMHRVSGCAPTSATEEGLIK